MVFLDKLEFLMAQKNVKNLKVLSEQSNIPYMTLRNFYIKGTENTKLSTLEKLRDFFGCTLDYLVVDEIENPTGYATDKLDQPRDFHIVDGEKICYEDMPEEAQKEFDAFLRYLRHRHNL